MDTCGGMNEKCNYFEELRSDELDKSLRQDDDLDESNERQNDRSESPHNISLLDGLMLQTYLNNEIQGHSDEDNNDEENLGSQIPDNDDEENLGSQIPVIVTTRAEKERKVYRENYSRKINLNSDLLISNSMMNVGNQNCRSLCPKLMGMVQLFQDLDLGICLMTETWTSQKSDKQMKELFEHIKNMHQLQFLFTHHGSRGGGVGICYRSDKMDVQKLNLPWKATSKFELIFCEVNILTHSS